MRFVFIIMAGLTLAAGCASAPEVSNSSEVVALTAKIASLEAENRQTRLKLADEMERADVQLYLTRQEIATAKRDAAAAKAKCGAPCASTPSQ